MSDPRLARPLWRGRTNVDALTIAALEKAEEIGGHEFVVTQGSYQSTVAASAGTHDGGGAVDLRWCGHDACIKALRLAGFAAWHRHPGQSNWPHHIHAVLVDHPSLAPSAARQVAAYRAGRNGLANNGTDDGPRITPIPVYRWQEEDDMKPEDFDRIQKMIDASVDRTAAKILSTKIELKGGKKVSVEQALRQAANSPGVLRELLKDAE